MCKTSLGDCTILGIVAIPAPISQARSFTGCTNREEEQGLSRQWVGDCQIRWHLQPCRVIQYFVSIFLSVSFVIVLNILSVLIYLTQRELFHLLDPEDSVLSKTDKDRVQEVRKMCEYFSQCTRRVTGWEFIMLMKYIISDQVFVF